MLSVTTSTMDISLMASHPNGLSFFIWHARFLTSDEGVFGLDYTAGKILNRPCIMLLGWF
jgi:hypothetical protein